MLSPLGFIKHITKMNRLCCPLEFKPFLRYKLSMRITDNTPIHKTTRRTVGKTGATAGFGAMLETGSSDDVAAPAPLANLDSVLPLQQDNSDNKQGKQRGTAMLKELDDMRIALLTGQVQVHKLKNLEEMVKTQRGDISDPRISEVLDEIELRVRVELAKLLG
jgi:hypothetical protein